MSDDFDFDSGESPTNRDAQEALGQSDAFLDFQERLSRAAPVNRPVLLIGERGTGKELAARRLHFLSRRWDGPFCAFNCAAVPTTLIEAELFGHEAGAFTGAGSRRIGRFESAHNGTLLLDEIGNTPIEAQEKIMRAVEYGTFERVGASKPTEVNVRIIGATNANLREMTEAGTFMPDLLDRLSFEVLVIPPLRERVEDIPLLANHFAARMAMELSWAGLPEITDEAMEELCDFHWPGNVRELKNVIERAVYRSNDMIIDKDELIFDPFEIFNTAPMPKRKSDIQSEGMVLAQASSPVEEVPGVEVDPKNYAEAIRELELRLLRKAMDNSKFNQTKAAEEMGLTYHQFRGLYKKYREDFEG